jgi:hypothetical protein
MKLISIFFVIFFSLYNTDSVLQTGNKIENFTLVNTVTTARFLIRLCRLVKG